MTMRLGVIQRHVIKSINHYSGLQIFMKSYDIHNNVRRVGRVHNDKIIMFLRQK